jgi:glycosyltransferase involved in cell wall biosynthesis
VKWHILTGEYPPSACGVGDYTALLARALADAGDTVDVWVADSHASGTESTVTVHALPDRFGSGARTALDAALDASPGIVLLQYVPNVLGARGANLAFCRWLRDRRRRGDDIRVMFHEPYMYFSFRRPWISFLALAQRVMASTLIEASTRVYFSTDQWHRYLRPHAASQVATLPIPSTITHDPDPRVCAEFRDRFTSNPGPVVGHFGTYGADVATELETVLRELLRRHPQINVALIGANGANFRQQLAGSLDANSIVATNRLTAPEVAAALAACDVLLQPYPDGATTRRTSLMAGLRQGVATVTTSGFLTEALWRKAGAVALAPAGDVRGLVTAVERLLASSRERLAQAERGRVAYAEHFSMDRTVAGLRRSPQSAPAGQM